MTKEEEKLAEDLAKKLMTPNGEEQSEEQTLCEFCLVIGHWATARNGSGTYFTLRMPDGRGIRVLPWRSMDAKRRAVSAWASVADDARTYYTQIKENSK
jgi:hypothetical protein